MKTLIKDSGKHQQKKKGKPIKFKYFSSDQENEHFSEV